MSTDELKKILLSGLIGIVVSGFLVLASYARITTPIQDVFDVIAEPVQSVGLSLDRSISGFFGSFGAFGRYRSENESLREEITLLRLQLAELEALRTENEYLKNVAGISDSPEPEYLMAEVLGYERDVVGVSGIKLSLGEKDGVEEGAIVFASQGALLGRVTSVGRYTCVIETIASPQARIPVKIVGSAGLGLLAGDDGNGLVIESVDRNAITPIGATAVTTGENGDYPALLIIGRVKGEEIDPASSFKKVVVEPLFDVESIRYVLIEVES